MKKRLKVKECPYMLLGTDDIVDRDTETDEIKNLVGTRAACAYILFSSPGIGKTYLTRKYIMSVNIRQDGIPIRVKTLPKNMHAEHEEGAYMFGVFEEIGKIVKALPKERQFKKLSFEHYILHCKDKALRRRLLENVIAPFFQNATTKGTILRIFFLYIIKRFLKLGEFNFYNILKENTLENRQIVSAYIKYFLLNKRVILSIDNLQNIDRTSLKFLLDWMSEAQESAPFFLLEYTLAENNLTEEMIKFIELVKETGIKTRYSPVAHLKSSDAVDAICLNSSTRMDESFIEDAKNFYIDHADGNIRKLVDYQITYTQSHYKQMDKSREFDPTLENLLTLTKDEALLFAGLWLLNGKASVTLLTSAFVPMPFADISIINKVISALQDEKKLIERDGDVLLAHHSSVLDTWKSNDYAHFTMAHLLACRLLSSVLQKQFDDSDNRYYSQGTLLLFLLKIYSLFDPSRIYNLVLTLDYKVMDSIDSRELLQFVQTFIASISNDEVNNDAICEKVLRICYDYELYAEGFNFVKQLQSKSKDNKRFLLYSYLFMTQLNKTNLVVQDVEAKRQQSEKDHWLWLNLSLILIINYRKMNQKSTCQLIANEIEQRRSYLEVYQEYGYFLRLKALYLPRNEGMSSVKDSIDFFDSAENAIQSGKSEITLAYYCAISGDLVQANQSIGIAETKLDHAHVALHIVENNKAAINLLSGRTDNEVWEELDRAELSASKAFDLLAVANNKLVWCLENRTYERCEYIVNKINRLFSFVPDKHMQAFINYNIYLLYRAKNNLEAAQKYYQRAYDLKEFCHTLDCRMQSKKTEDNTDFLLTKPWHVCFLTYWCFDLLDYK